MNEQKIIAALVESRDAYEKVRPWLAETDFTAKGWVIAQAVQAYYQADEKAQACDTDVLMARIARKLPNEKLAEPFETIFAALPHGMGAANIVQELLTLKRDAAADNLQQALAVRSGAEAGDIDDALQAYQELHEATSLEHTESLDAYDVGLTELFTRVLADENKIRIAPKEFNDRIGGGLLPGHFLIIFGRVEMGKSLCALNIAAGIVTQGHRCLYLENEDPLPDTMRRFTQRLIQRPKEWIMQNPQKAEQMAQSKGNERFILMDAPDTVRGIEAAIRKHKPQAVIVNQMRNMVQGDDNVASLDRLAFELRRLWKRTGVAGICITAAREGEVDRDGYIKPKHILQTGDVYSSRTGIPAQADVLAGWGGSEKLHAAQTACVSICKNKLLDGGNTHGHFYVTVDPATGMVRSKPE